MLLGITGQSKTHLNSSQRLRPLPSVVCELIFLSGYDFFHNYHLYIIFLASFYNVLMNKPTQSRLVCSGDLPGIVFAVLSACRHHGQLNMKGLRRMVRLRAPFPIPRLAQWLQLRQAAHLIEYHPYPKPTQPAFEWFSHPFVDQCEWILRIWCSLAQSQIVLNCRTRLCEHIIHGKPVNLKSMQMRRQVIALANLGIIEGESQTSLPYQPALQNPGPWQIDGLSLIVPFPADLSLLWKLENYLQPVCFGTYSLARPALRLAAQHRDLPNLVQILERGLQQPLPFGMKERLDNIPAVTILPGPVLAFSGPEELAGLR